MKDDRNTGVTEARFALTLVICLLVAAGYIVLYFVLLPLGGGSNNSPIEVRPDVIAQPTPPREDPTRPRVLPVDEPGVSGSNPQEIATLPELAPGNESNSTSSGSNSPNDAQRR